MARLILHAGTHKTGTSAIQAFAMTNRAALAERGWIYPSLAPFAEDGKLPHILFAHALAGRRDELLAARDARRLPRHWARQAEAAGANLFVSAEPLCRHVLRHAGARDWLSGRRAYLRRLAGALASFDVEPILVFRRPDDFVRARYQENVQTAVRPRWTSFAAFKREGRDSMLRYADNAELFAEAFPRTRVLIYEDLAGGDGFCDRFFAAVGIDASGLPEPGRVRAGLSAAQIAAKLALAELDDKNRTNPELMRLLRSPRVVRALERSLGAGPFGFWTDSAERAKVVQAREADLERLRARFLPERATLFPPLPADEPPPVPAFSDALRRDLARAAAKAPARTKVARAVESALDHARRATVQGAS